MARSNRAPEFLGIFVTLTTIATILVGLRFWARIRLVRNVGWDDWFVLVSLILMFGSLGCIGTAVHYGLGQHYDTLTPYNAKMAIKMLWITFQITPSSEMTAKISITILLMRITPSKTWRYFFIFWIVIAVFITVASIYSILLSCHPVEMLWDPTAKGSCDALERTVDIYIQGILASLYDIVLAVSPIFLLWNVQISPRTKYALCGLLALGFFTAASCIARTAYTSDIVTKDPTYGLMTFLTWKGVELPLSIIVGCLPTLRPLYEKSTYYTRNKLSNIAQVESEAYSLRQLNRC